jgi:hypothetical protein
MRLYFGTAFKHKTTERSQKIKPLFQKKKKPRSVPGFIVRAQQSRTAFEKGGFISTLFFNTNQPGGHKKLKPLFQQKSRDPHQASLHAYNNAVRLSKNTALFQHGLSTLTKTPRGHNA